MNPQGTLKQPATPSPTPADIRVFRAANTRAALAAIKEALGSDAVILETREVGGLFGKPEIEVTVSPPPAPPPAPTRAPADDEVARLRREVERLTAAQAPAGAAYNRSGTSPGRATIYNRLVRRGVEEDLAFSLLREAERHGAANAQELEGEVERLIRTRLACAEVPWRADASKPRPRVLALVGPTGVGKTTTIAKIAARALLEGHLKVALVTVDVYRLGASEQLARYGRIMGVPTFVARDQSALADAVARARGADLVLVDTAGRSDAAARDEQTRLLRSVSGIELGLVLSAGTGGRELAAMARKHAPAKPDLLILSKLDEADGPGSVLSAASILPRPIACITDGQRVPEDIHPASARQLARLVLGREGEAAEGL